MTRWFSKGNIFTYPDPHGVPATAFTLDELAALADANWGITLEVDSYSGMQQPAYIESVMVPFINYIHDNEPTVPITIEMEKAMGYPLLCHNEGAACGTGLTCYNNFELPVTTAPSGVLGIDAGYLANLATWTLETAPQNYYNVYGYWPYWWWTNTTEDYEERLGAGMDVLEGTGYISAYGFEEAYDNGVVWLKERVSPTPIIQYWVYSSNAAPGNTTYKGYQNGTAWRMTYPDYLMNEVYFISQATGMLNLIAAIDNTTLPLRNKPLGLTTKISNNAPEGADTPPGWNWWSTNVGDGVAPQRQNCAYYFYLIKLALQAKVGHALDCTETLWDYTLRDDTANYQTLYDTVSFFDAGNTTTYSEQIELTNIAAT
jgi:hypothetical protein